METPDFGIPEQLVRRMSMAEQHEYLRAALPRRRALLTVGATAGGLLTGCSSSGAATADRSPAPNSTARVPGSAVTPFGRHLAFGADPKTQMRVSWQVPFTVKKPYIRVGLKPDDLSRRIGAEVRDLSTPGAEGIRGPYQQYYVHAALDGLRPDTTYYYGVGHDGFDPASPPHRSTIGSFRTAPASPERFVFTAFGDQGVNPAALANDKVLLRQKPAFHLHAGDICYANSSGHGEKKDLFFIFKDLSSRKETYEAGRFLHTPLPVDRVVDLDFNRAYNPPCAFTEFATCPLPVKENQLAIAIRAGELRFHSAKD